MQRIFRVLCILLLVSCSCDNKVDDLLSQASDIADENPDSAYHLLDSCKATINKASRKQKNEI